MTAVQALTGGGGWPMRVWLTPEREPFFGGTYFPPRDGDRGGGAGFLTVLQTLADGVRRAAASGSPRRPASLAAAGPERTSSARRRGDAARRERAARSGATAIAPRAASTRARRRRAARRSSRATLPVRFLLRYHRRTGDAEALHMATSTLEQMAAGGMHDQVGGGFHRYATDARWLVPHFEKMLYDNALLAVAYLEAYQATGRDDFADVARDILRYVDARHDGARRRLLLGDRRRQPGPDGRREEGWFFTWTPDEIDAVLGAGRGARSSCATTA